MCMCNPVTVTLCLVARATLSSNCSCQIPCLDDSPPVLVFGAVPMTEPGIDSNGDFAPWNTLAVLLDHVRRSNVDVKAFVNDEIECFAIEDISRVNDGVRRSAVLETSLNRAKDFASTNRINQNSIFAHQIENGNIRIRFLSVSNHIKLTKLLDSIPDRLGIVKVGRSPKLLGQLLNRMA